MRKIDNIALVPKPRSSVEKFEPGANRVLSVMVTETLAIAQKQQTLILTEPTQSDLEDWYQEGKKHHNGLGVPRNSTEAVKWYRKAAEHGHIEAQAMLGTCYHRGDGVAQTHTEAARWHRTAAEKGHAGAQLGLGWCYEFGHGVPKDCKEAAKWFCKADRGHAEDQYNLGCALLMSAIKEGDVPYFREGLKWIRMAVEQGHAGAQFSLGWCYHNGQGVKADQIEAHKCFRLAYDLGHKGAKDEVVLIEALLSTEDLQEAERRYSEFKASHKT